MPILKKITLPGFERVPIYKVFRILLKEIMSPIMILRAKAIAYSFFMAIFPSVIFLFSLISYLPFPNITNDIIGYLKNIMPNKQMVDVFIPIINDVVTKPKVGIMSIGFIFIILFMKNGVITMMQSFNIHFNRNSGSNFIKNQILSIVITFIILFLFLVTIILLVLGKEIMTIIFNFFDYDGAFLKLLIDLLRYSISIALNFIVISILYYLGPSVRPLTFKIFTPGSIAATSLIVLVSLLFSYYIKNFGNYNKLYGSLGTILLTLVWLYWNSLAILIGYELNRSIQSLKNPTRTPRKVTKRA